MIFSTLYGRQVKFLGLFIFLSTFTFSQASSGGAAICPLSEAQVQKSIDAFAKLVPTLTEEPRCVNCHGGVNPFIDGVGDPSDPTASRVEHGGGKMEKGSGPTASNPKGTAQSDCADCHSKMVPKHPSGAPSEWKIPPEFLFFVGKDATALCKQIKDFARGCSAGADGVSTCGPWPNAEKFISHITDDEHNDNFTATAFKGDRGLDREMYPESEVPSQPPAGMTAGGFLGLGNQWVGVTGGEFKGDKDCGCEPSHYAIRVSATNEMNFGPIHHRSEMPPVEVPITFEDDGTFKGEGVAKFVGQATVAMCNGQYTDSLKFKVTGDATETEEEQSMHIKLENTSPDESTMSAQCPGASVSKSDSHAGTVTLPFDMEGNVGEALDYVMPPPAPGMVSNMRVEIVKLDPQ